MTGRRRNLKIDYYAMMQSRTHLGEDESAVSEVVHAAAPGVVRVVELRNVQPLPAPAAAVAGAALALPQGLVQLRRPAPPRRRRHVLHEARVVQDAAQELPRRLPAAPEARRLADQQVLFFLCEYEYEYEYEYERKLSIRVS